VHIDVIDTGLGIASDKSAIDQRGDCCFEAATPTVRKTGIDFRIDR